ncbi:MAG: lytic transglycosylase domain-containing protein, partial [Magnetovibrio sp.]|nr:lytic transglycosylase domain-containing protein [Magnetovibrio sp.]
KLIARLDDRLLMGHVQAQRFLHPTKYRSKYKELKTWLGAYSDHHNAAQLYKLALRRRPSNWKYPTKPQYGRALYKASVNGKVLEKPKRKRLSRNQRRRVYRMKIAIKTHLRKGHTLAVKRMLATAEAKKLFDAYNMDWAKARLAKGYFMAGRDEWAVKWAEEAANRSGKFLSSAHWTAAMAHWRLGHTEQAAVHFEKAAQFDNSAWTSAASSFWAARAHLISRHPAKVTPLLEAAASYPRTFYGMLANKILGRDEVFDWTMPSMQGKDVRALQNHDGGRRALALLQVGQDARAEKEMRQVAKLAPAKMAKGILSIAAQAGMAELTIRLDAMLHPNGGGLDGAAYPLPSWEPQGGFKVDRALIYALVRQESRFNPNAKSGAGARGLMQLMPGTASFVARDRTFRWRKRVKLFEPELNLKLGQKYISMLLGDKKINGDLFLMAAAWNGGPGNLNKWRRNINHMNDPLFFIESLPSRETRSFIEHVLSNLWIYRNQLGQPSPSLDEVASGVWPAYQSFGQEADTVALNVTN